MLWQPRGLIQPNRNWRRPQGGATFVPSDTANAVSWWDASNTGSITSSGGVVSQLADLITTNHLAPNALGTGNTGPTTGSLTVNSNNTISVLTSQSAIDLGRAMPGSQQTIGTLYLVMQVDAAHANGAAYTIGVAGAPAFMLYSNHATQFLAQGNCNGIGATSFGGATDRLGLHVFRLDWDTAGSGPMAILIDNAADSSTTGFTGFGATSKLAFFTNWFSGAVLSSRFCEALLLSGQPSAGDNTSLISYWQTKWGTP